jgi:hypothetical protein
MKWSKIWKKHWKEIILFVGVAIGITLMYFGSR